MKDQTREEPKIVAAAERQMQAWAHTQESGPRVRIHPAHARIGPYVSISREAGAGGSWIAQRVGELLGWEVLDRNLLDRVAQRCRASRLKLNLVDETRANWAFDIFGPWLDQEIISHEKYVAHLSRVVVAAARRGNVVLVGRGAQFLLPRDCGLAVRIIAPLQYRVERIMESCHLSAREARRFMQEVDRGRREFVQRFFHHDIDDPHLYDVTINVEHVGLEAAAQQIGTALNFVSVGGAEGDSPIFVADHAAHGARHKNRDSPQ